MFFFKRHVGYILYDNNSPQDFLTSVIFELRHDKTNKMSVRPVTTQISLGIRPV